jgi:hypothetical protein
MSNFVETLKLAEKAAEDIYFAKVNRELIESLRSLRQTVKSSPRSNDRNNAEAPAGDSDSVMNGVTGS